MALEGSYGDGSVEIVVQTFGSGCFVFTVPGSAENNLFWPTGRGNYLRNGRPWTDTVRDCPADLDENNDVYGHDLTLFADNFNSDGNDLAAFAADLGQNAYP